MILIADSGSTKTTWAHVCGDGSWECVETAGLNPVHMNMEQMASAIEALATRCSGVRHVYFYGAGCVKPFAEKVFSVLCKMFVNAIVHVESALLGAARAICGREKGVACILGTGSNSCLYDGEHIVGQIPPLGYILGDEGSGAALGKRFLNALFKGELPLAMREDYMQKTGLSYSDVIEKVYRQPLANRFLASTSLYIAQAMACPGGEVLRKLVADCFDDFFQKNVMHYECACRFPVSFVGSIAFAYQDILREVAERQGYDVSRIEKSPMKGLVDFHFNRS